jgi:hypothetical protein
METMMKTTQVERLRKTLGRLIGMQVCRCGLLVWPDEQGLKEISKSLYLELSDNLGASTGVSFGISPDGQTPQVEFETWPEQYRINDLESRAKLWQTREFWEKPQRGCECFDVSGAEEYAGIVGHSLAEIAILCLAGAPEFPTGIRLGFDFKKDLYVVPSAGGSAVFCSLPSNWFPSRHQELLVQRIS